MNTVPELKYNALKKNMVSELKCNVHVLITKLVSELIYIALTARKIYLN